ncbi:hypothetical protein [Thermus oshimai]
MPVRYEGRFRLVLSGPARLERGGQAVRVRRKALALLYYLALEGPARRALLADLLWGHGAALQNLRVELHHLNEVLGGAFFRGQDPLSLPPVVELAEGTGEVPLEGLEGLSPEWDGWLQGLRARLGSRPQLQPLPERLRGVGPPHLLLLISPLGSDPEGVARALARHLGLPYRVGLGRGRGVFYLSEPFPPAERAAQMAENREGVYVLARSALGEDPPFFLAARVQYPPARTRVVTLEPLSWLEARRGPLKGMPFEEAARYYLHSGGWPLFLAELLAVGNPEALPQRVRAAVMLEASRLTPEERLALERLSVHPGPLEEGLVEALGASEVLERLEALHWLSYREGGWVFADEVVRRVFCSALEPGVKRRLHRLAAEWLEAKGRLWAAFYHRVQLGEGPQDPPPLPPFLEGRLVLDAWPQEGVGRGRRLHPELLPQGPVVLEGEEAAWTQRDGVPSALSWSLEAPALLELEARVFLASPLRVGLSGAGWPLVLQHPLGAVYFLPYGQAGRRGHQGVLPLEGGPFRLFLPPGFYQLQSHAERALVELRLRFYEAQPGEEAAFSLEALSPSPGLGPVGAGKGRGRGQEEEL